MSTSNASHNEHVPILEDVIDKTLINKVIAELSASSVPTSGTITTRYPWTTACDELLQYYVKNVHRNVSLRGQAQQSGLLTFYMN